MKGGKVPERRGVKRIFEVEGGGGDPALQGKVDMAAGNQSDPYVID